MPPRRPVCGEVGAPVCRSPGRRDRTKRPSRRRPHRHGAVGKIISNIVSPPIMFALIGLALGVYERSSGRGWAGTRGYSLLIAPTPMLVIFTCVSAASLICT